MNFKPKNLKNLFNALRKTPVDDIAIKAAKSNVDDVARGALDIVDDIPSSISFDDIADTYNYRKNMPQPKSYDDLISTLKTDLSNKHDSRVMNSMFPGYGEIVSGADTPRYTDFTDADVPPLPLDSTPDYKALNIDPYYYGRRHSPDSMTYPNGFEFPEDFANYYDALENGFSHRYASNAAVEEAYNGAAADPYIYANITLPKDLRNTIKDFENYGSGLYEGYDNANSMYDSHKQSLKDAVRKWLYHNYT